MSCRARVVRPCAYAVRATKDGAKPRLTRANAPFLRNTLRDCMAYLRWNSGEPSVSAAICGALPAFAIVARVDSDSSPPSRSDGDCVVWETTMPRSRLLARARAKFMRPTSAPVLTHASAVSLYPVGG